MNIADLNTRNAEAWRGCVYSTRDAFKESEHPRKDNGEFGRGGVSLADVRRKINDLARTGGAYLLGKNEETPQKVKRIIKKLDRYSDKKLNQESRLMLLDPCKLISGQPYVVPDTLRHLLKDSADANEPVLVVAHEGKHYLVNGNHRAVLAKFKGVKVKARVLDA